MIISPKSPLRWETSSPVQRRLILPSGGLLPIKFQQFNIDNLNQGIASHHPNPE
ncbi:hypothetical protein KBT16_17430 [Nostoc sp. CCCryo 231-06]|nr:hypothetical protein [Nostoc sp. CCCryo 231-06]